MSKKLKKFTKIQKFRNLRPGTRFAEQVLSRDKERTSPPSVHSHGQGLVVEGVSLTRGTIAWVACLCVCGRVSVYDTSF